MNERVDLRAGRMKAKRRRKAIMKNWIILIQTAVIFVLIIALIIVGVNYYTLSKEASGGAPDSLAVQSENTSDTASADAASKVLWMKSETKQWYLKLVNPDTGVDNEFIRNVKLANIDTRFTDGKESSKYFDERAVEALNSLCEAALEDNIQLKCISTYRTYAYQQSLFNNRIQRYLDQGYSEANAKAAAATVVAQPGTSEHHMGLAVDFNSVEENFDTTAAYRWLQENAEDYGFILRYRKDKTDITKIIYEPWHYRYVGVEHAKAINDLDMCLEEYIEYLENGGNI